MAEDESKNTDMFGTSDNKAFLAALKVMGRDISYDEYKKMVDAAVKSKDVSTLNKILNVCRKKIELRSPGSTKATKADNVNGVDIEVSGPEKDSAEGKAIRLILTGGSNWFTSTFTPSKIRLAKNGASSSLAKSSIYKDGMSNIAEKILYGAKQAERDGSVNSIADSVADNMARSMLLEDLGKTDYSKGLEQVYRGMLNRYRSQPGFTQNVRMYAAQKYIDLTKDLPDSMITEPVQKGLAEARQILSEKGTWAKQFYKDLADNEEKYGGAKGLGKALKSTVSRAFTGASGSAY